MVVDLYEGEKGDGSYRVPVCFFVRKVAPRGVEGLKERRGREWGERSELSK